MIDATYLRLLTGTWLQNVPRPFCVLVPIRTPPCVHCGQTGVVLLSTENAMRLYANTGRIQDDLPNVSASIREQLMTGIHPACWD